MADSLLTTEEFESARLECDLLQQVLGIPLDVCVFDREWQTASATPACPTLACAPSVTPPRRETLTALPHPSAGRRRAFAHVSEDNMGIIGIPLETAGGKPVFSVGRMGLQADELLQLVAQQAEEIRTLRRQLEENAGRLDVFADQVLQDFEERNWLIRLTRHLQMCELNRDIADVVESMLPELKAVIGAEQMAFLPCSEQDGRLVGMCRAVTTPDGPTSLTQLRSFVDANEAEARNQSLILNWWRAGETRPSIPGVTSLMLTGIAREDRSIGWLLAINRQLPEGSVVGLTVPHDDLNFADDGFGTAEAGLLESAAAVLATHHHNMAMFQANKDLTVGAIRSLANAVDARDTYTRGHSERVARMGQLLALVSGQDATRCEQMLLTGLLHDIGKIGVPDRVLLKPGKLNDEEFEQIKRHPVIGHRILSHIRELAYTLDGVLYHHEHWSGGGYPKGLKETAIPLDGRILAIVDAYDAMTSNRPYRDGMSFEKAESILQEGAGVQWDPQLVAAFLEHRDEFRQICTDFGLIWGALTDQCVLPVAADRLIPARPDQTVATTERAPLANGLLQ